MAHRARSIFPGIGKGGGADSIAAMWDVVLGTAAGAPASTGTAPARGRPARPRFAGIGQGLSGDETAAMWDRAFQTARGAPC